MSMIEDAMDGRRWPVPQGAEDGPEWAIRISRWRRMKTRAILWVEVRRNG